MNQKSKPHETGRRAMDRRKACFKTAVRAWATRLKVQPAQIRVQPMRNKWASCSPGQWISFNTNLLNTDTEFQDYVMVHELLHLRVPNHGKLFKALMTIHLPGREQRDVHFADLRVYRLKKIGL